MPKKNNYSVVSSFLIISIISIMIATNGQPLMQVKTTGNTGVEYNAKQVSDYVLRSSSSAETTHVDRWNNACFLAETQILMADKTYKKIEDVKVGDIVLSFDDEKNSLSESVVKQVFVYQPEEISYLYLKINGNLKVAPHQKFYSEGKWISAEEFSAGDMLFSSELEDYKIESISRVYKQVESYDLDVEDIDNFFVNIDNSDVLVHNSGATGYKYPSSTGSKLEYDQWEDPENAFNNDLAWATIYNIGDKQDYYDFSFDIPTNSEITAIKISVRAYTFVHTIPKPPNPIPPGWGTEPFYIDCFLTWSDYADGSLTETQTRMFDPNDDNWVKDFGGEPGGGSEIVNWGREWSPSDFSNSNFRVCFEYADGGPNYWIYIYYVRAVVYYNAPPIAEDDNADIIETINNGGSSMFIDVADNDYDQDLDGLDYSSIDIKSPTSFGNARVVSTGKNYYSVEYEYEGDNGDTTTDTFTYTIKDNAAMESNIATVTVTIPTEPDYQPQAEEDDATTIEDVPVNIDVLDNDDFGGNGPATGAITISTQPTHGNAAVNTGGTPSDPTDDSIDYTPDSGFTGSDTMIYQIEDSDGDTDTATVTILVSGPPIVNDIPDKTIDEGEIFSSFDLDDHVFDPDNLDSEITWTYSGDNDLTINIDSNHIVTITYTPGWTGSETITFTATDPDLLSDSDTAKYTVNPVNDPPIVNDIPDKTIDQGQSFTTFDLDNYVNDPDNTDSEITWTYTGNNELTINIDSNNIITITYTPSWTGSETITFTATDPDLLSDSDTAKYTVNPVDSPKPNKPVLQSGVMVCYTEIGYIFESYIDNDLVRDNAQYYYYWDDDDGLDMPTGPSNDPNNWKDVPDVSIDTITLESGTHSWSKSGVYDIKVGVYDPDYSSVVIWSQPLPIKVMHKFERPEDII